MKKLIPLLLLAVILGGCGKDGRPVKRTMAAAAYYTQNDETGGVYYTIYLVEKARNLRQDPLEPSAMVAVDYLNMKLHSAGKSMEGTYKLIFYADHCEPGEATLYDHCDGARGIGPIEEGTVTIGENSLTIIGKTPHGNTYEVTYSGSFQQASFITTAEK